MRICANRVWPAVAGLCFAVVFGAGLSAVKAAAQTEVERARVAAQVARVAGKLPAESQEVITRLTRWGTCRMARGRCTPATWRTARR